MDEKSSRPSTKLVMITKLLHVVQACLVSLYKVILLSLLSSADISLHFIGRQRRGCTQGPCLPSGHVRKNPQKCNERVQVNDPSQKHDLYNDSHYIISYASSSHDQSTPDTGTPGIRLHRRGTCCEKSGMCLMCNTSHVVSCDNEGMHSLTIKGQKIQNGKLKEDQGKGELFVGQTQPNWLTSTSPY